MEWNEALKTANAQPIVCLEIACDGHNFHFADTGLREDDAYWEPRLMSLSPVSRSVDPEGRRFDIGDVVAILDNNQLAEESGGYFGNLLNQYDFENRRATLYLKFKLEDGTVLSRRVYQGACSPVRLAADRFELRIRPSISESLSQLQRTIDTLSFTTAPETSNGTALNIIFGTVSSDSGAVECHKIDTTDRKYALAQHGICSVQNVYRMRDGIFTELSSASSEYTLTSFATDGNGDPYSCIQIASSVHQDDDRYFVNLNGLPDATKSYISLDGTSDYLSIADEDGQIIPGRENCAGTFTIETRFRSATIGSGSSQDVCGLWQVGKRCWRIALIGSSGLARLYLSEDGISVYYAQANTTTLANDTDYTLRAIYDPDAGVQIWINGVAQSLTESGTVPSALNITNSDFYIGSNASPIAPFQGRIYYAVFNQLSSPLASGAASWRDAGGVMEELVSEWQFSFDGSDTQGNNHLVETSLSFDDGDYTTPSPEMNPAFAVRQLLLQCGDLKSEDLWEEGFCIAASTCEDRGYADSGEFGCCVPLQSGTVEHQQNPWSLVQDICRSFNHAIATTRDGTCTITALDTSQLTDQEMVHYVEKNGDFTDSGLQLDLKPIKILNDQKHYYKCAHSAGNNLAKRLQARNESSILQVGRRGTTIMNRTAQSTDSLKDGIEREMSMMSGRMRAVSWEIPGLWGLQDGSDIGDIVALTHGRALGQWENQQVRITSTEARLLEGTTRLGGLCVGSEFFMGAISFSEDISLTLDSDLNTYVESTTPNNSYGDRQYYVHGQDDTLMNYTFRGALRFDLSPVYAAGGTIRRASLQLYVEVARDAIHLQLRTLNETSWGDSSTFNHFAGNGTGAAWSDLNIDSTLPAPQVQAGVGFRTFQFNSDGIAYLNSQLGSGNQAHFTHHPCNWTLARYHEAYQITSHSGLVSRRPQLTVVYTT